MEVIYNEEKVTYGYWSNVSLYEEDYGIIKRVRSEEREMVN